MLQLAVVKDSVVCVPIVKLVSTVTSPLSLATVTVTLPVGRLLSRTV